MNRQVSNQNFLFISLTMPVFAVGSTYQGHERFGQESRGLQCSSLYGSKYYFIRAEKTVFPGQLWSMVATSLKLLVYRESCRPSRDGRSFHPAGSNHLIAKSSRTGECESPIKIMQPSRKGSVF